MYIPSSSLLFTSPISLPETGATLKRSIDQVYSFPPSDSASVSEGGGSTSATSGRTEEHFLKRARPQAPGMIAATALTHLLPAGAGSPPFTLAAEPLSRESLLHLAGASSMYLKSLMLNFRAATPPTPFMPSLLASTSGVERVPDVAPLPADAVPFTAVASYSTLVAPSVAVPTPALAPAASPGATHTSISSAASSSRDLDQALNRVTRRKGKIIRWSKEEERALKELAEAGGRCSWSLIAEKLTNRMIGPPRSDNQCRLRYQRIIDLTTKPQKARLLLKDKEKIQIVLKWNQLNNEIRTKGIMAKIAKELNRPYMTVKNYIRNYRKSTKEQTRIAHLIKSRARFCERASPPSDSSSSSSSDFPTPSDTSSSASTTSRSSMPSPASLASLAPLPTAPVARPELPAATSEAVSSATTVDIVQTLYLDDLPFSLPRIGGDLLSLNLEDSVPPLC